MAEALGYKNCKALLNYVDSEDRKDGVAIRDGGSKDKSSALIQGTGE